MTIKLTPFALAACAALCPPVARSADAAASPLSPVMVTATRFAEDADKLPLGVSVITAQEIRDSGVTTVNEAVMKLLGVPGQQDLYGGGNYSLDLRGFGTTADNNQVIVVDGVRLNEPDLSGTRLAGIPIDSVDRIEVLRGSGSVLYGEGATGGVIVITTKAGQGRDRRNSGYGYGAVGSDRLRELRAGTTLVAGDVSVDLAANRRSSDNHRDNFHSRTEGASVAAQWAHDGLRAGGGVGYDDLDSRLPGSLTAAQYAANPRQTNTPLAYASIRNERANLFAEATLGDWVLVAEGGKRHRELRSLSSYDAGASYSPYDYDIDATTFGLRAKHQQRFAGMVNAVVMGFDRNQWSRNTAATSDSKGWYLKDDLTLPIGTRLSAGYRSEDVRRVNGGVMADDQKAWELGLTQPLGVAFAVYARYGQSFRLPSIDEFGFTLPGVALRAQTSRDAEIGGRWHQGGSRAEVRVYRSQITHEIGYDPVVANTWGPGANVNFDPTQRQGVEAEVAQAVGRTVQLRANAALRRAKFREGAYAGRDVALTPRRTVALRADWKPVEDHQLGAVLNWVSSQYPDFANECRMPGYATADLRYAYQWGRAQWALSVNNVADRKYYSQAYDCTAGVTESIYPDAGRTVSASVRVQF